MLGMINTRREILKKKYGNAVRSHGHIDEIRGNRRKLREIIAQEKWTITETTIAKVNENQDITVQLILNF